MTEQFEQAKRELEEKWGYTISCNSKKQLYNANCKRTFRKDLAALLEQHKEVIKEELRKKLLSMRATKEEMDKLDKEDRLMQYGYHHCINEMLLWTKNVKK